MKIRKELAFAKQKLGREIGNELDGHSCSNYCEEGMTCVICCLHALHKPLALLQYLRAKGVFADVVLQAESTLFDLLGEKQLKQKTKEEVEIVRNIPKKACFNCGKIVAIWMPYSTASLYVRSLEEKKIGTNCQNCGQGVYFSSDELRYKKRSKDKLHLAYAIGLAHRLGYYSNDNDNEDYGDEDENNDENED